MGLSERVAQRQTAITPGGVIGMSDVKPILVPLDGSSAAERAMPVAAAIARATNSTLRIFHAMELEPAPTVAEFDRARDLFVSYARGVTSRSCVPAMQHQPEVDIRIGSPTSTILEGALESSMVVIASHGRGGFSAAMIGSVADKVVRGAQVPVLVVPALRYAAPLEGAPILIAVDGSEASELALIRGRRLAAALHSPVTLVRAFSVPPPVGAEFAYYPMDLLDTMQKSADEYLQKTAVKGEATHLAQGQPAQVIIEAAERLDAGLVVMASTGKGRTTRLTLGSVTDRVLHSLRRPLLIIPADD
jgi:nucleotide-binding universal stress UspA family protein